MQAVNQIELIVHNRLINLWTPDAVSNAVMLKLGNATQSCHDHMSYDGMSGGRSFVEELLTGIHAIHAVKKLLERVASTGFSIILVIFDNYVNQRWRKKMHSDE